MVFDQRVASSLAPTVELSPILGSPTRSVAGRFVAARRGVLDRLAFVDGGGRDPPANHDREDQRYERMVRTSGAIARLTELIMAQRYPRWELNVSFSITPG